MRNVPRVASGLTERQHDVVMLAAKGYTIEEIAQRLFLTRNTVRQHLRVAHDASKSPLPLRLWVIRYARKEWLRADLARRGGEYAAGVRDGRVQGRAEIIAALRPVIDAAEREMERAA